MTVLYLAQQKSSIPSHPGSQHSNSDISFWSSVSSLIIAVKCFLFSLILNFFLLLYLFMMCCDWLFGKSRIAKFHFTAATEGNYFSWFLRKIKFFLWLFLSFTVKFRLQVFLYFSDASIRDTFNFSTQSDEVLI